MLIAVRALSTLSPTRIRPVGVNPIYGIPIRKPVQVNPSVVSDGVSVDEPTCSGVVVAVTQQEQRRPRIAGGVGLALPLGEIAKLTPEPVGLAPSHVFELLIITLFRRFQHDDCHSPD